MKGLKRSSFSKTAPVVPAGAMASAWFPGLSVAVPCSPLVRSAKATWPSTSTSTPPKAAAWRAMARDRPKAMVTSLANTDAVGAGVAASSRWATIETLAPASSTRPGAEMATAPEQAGVAASLTFTS